MPIEDKNPKAWKNVQEVFTDINYVYQPLPWGEFVGTVSEKDGIIRHCTVSSSIKYLRDVWANDPQGAVATHFAIEKDGTIYQYIPEENWAFHTGMGQAYDMKKFGIEQSNEAYLKRINGQFFWMAGNQWKPYTGKVFTSNLPFQGFNYWAAYTTEQVDAQAKLIAYLCYKHGIELKFWNEYDYLGSGAPKTGVLNHSNISTQRADPGPAYPYETETKLIKQYFESLCRRFGFPVYAKKP